VTLQIKKLDEEMSKHAGLAQLHQCFSMQPCRLKLDKEKYKHIGLAQQNGFGPAFSHSSLVC
jgi:hypothetical protein